MLQYALRGATGIPVFQISISDRLEQVSADWPTGASAENGARFHPFQSVTFLKVWIDTFGRSGERNLHFIEVRDGDGRPLLFVPLCIARRSGARVLEFIDGEAADYNAPVLFPTSIAWTRELAERLWQEILAILPSFDVEMLSKMPAEVDGLVNPLGLIGDLPNDLSCHASDLRRPWAEIEAAVPQRRTLMRKMRNLEKLAPLEFRLAEGEEERRAATAAFLRQKQWRFEQTRVPGFDVDRDKHDFFHDGTHVFAREGMLKLFTLSSGGTIIATVWGLVAGRRYYAVMLSFQPGDWARYSPGGVLHYRILQWLHANGFEWIDLGIGDEAWKLESCETTFSLTARQVPATLAGRAFLLRGRLMLEIRATRLWQSIRPLKWVVLRRLRQGFLSLPGYGVFSELLLPIITKV